jgi:hypothetical protein
MFACLAGEAGSMQAEEVAIWGQRMVRWVHTCLGIRDLCSPVLYGLPNQ